MDTSIIFPNLHITLDNVGKNISIGNFAIAFYGIIIAIGMLLGVGYILREAKRLGKSEDDFLDICIYTIVFAVIGARLYYVMFSWEYYKDNLLSIVNLRQGGLAIYGGVLVGILSVFIFSKRMHYDVLEVFDICFPGVVIGQILGRWGNFFNREVFGGYTNNIFAMLLPINSIRSQADVTQEMLDNLVIIDGVQYISVHPTFLYESLWNLALFILMHICRKHKMFHGQILCMYMIGYGIGRFWIEGVRTDRLMLWNTNIPVSQAVALVMIVLGFIIAVYNYHKNKISK